MVFSRPGIEASLKERRNASGPSNWNLLEPGRTDAVLPSHFQVLASPASYAPKTFEDSGIDTAVRISVQTCQNCRFSWLRDSFHRQVTRAQYLKLTSRCAVFEVPFPQSGVATGS